MSEGFGVGRTIAHAFSIWITNFWQLMLIAATILWPLLFFMGPSAESNPGMELLSTFSQLVLSPIVTGALAYNVFQHLRKRQVSISQSLAVGLSRILFVLGVTMLSGIGIVLGILLLIVPGVILACKWYVAIPVIVVEQTGVTDALSRSSELTQGNRWTIFIIYLLFLGISAVILVLAGVAAALRESATRWIIWGFVVAETVFGAIMHCLVYYELKVLKEGVDIEELAAVFD